MRELEIMIVLLITGFSLMIGGYSKREGNTGMCLITLGIMIVFSTIGYKLYLELSL